MTKTISDIPWLVPSAIVFLDAIVKRSHDVLETGAGGSTIWFAHRAKSVVSMEHKSDWHASVQRRIVELDLKNVHLVLAPEYPTAGFMLDGPRFDIILVDGRGRCKTIDTIFKNLKPGGWIILDNSERVRYSPAIEFLNMHATEVATFRGTWQTTFWKKR